MTQNERLTFSFPLGGLFLAATLVLFVLKATVYPALDWWIVLAPAVIGIGVPLAIFLVIGLIALGMLLILPAVDRRHKRKLLRRRNQMYRGVKP